MTLSDTVFADLTGDNLVNFADLTLLLSNWNKGAAQMVGSDQGNLVDPGGSVVNFQDLTILLAAWTGAGGAAAPQGAAAEQAVPEPSTVVLLAIGALAGLPLLRRRSVARRRG